MVVELFIGRQQTLIEGRTAHFRNQVIQRMVRQGVFTPREGKATFLQFAAQDVAQHHLTVVTVASNHRLLRGEK